MAAANNSADSSQDSTNSRFQRANILTGALPDDFLRISSQSANGDAISQGSQGVYAYPNAWNGLHASGGMLIITVVQARLAKNYGVTRMDPYCRLRIGAHVFETPTAYNGAKTPRWNKYIQSPISEQTKEIYLELFDERTFSIDERIAWTLINIKDSVFSGEVLDEWYSLSGKQGEEKEGMIQVVLQYKKAEGSPFLMGGPMMMGAPMVYGTTPLAYGYPPLMYAPQGMVPVVQQQQAPPVPQSVTQSVATSEVKEQDLKTLKEMFPNMDEEILQLVLQQTGNVDRAAAQLLEM